MASCSTLEEAKLPGGYLVTPRVPQGLAAAVEGLTREVLRHSPKDIYVFAAHHFEQLLRMREECELGTIERTCSSHRDDERARALREMSRALRTREFERATNSRTTRDDRMGWSLNQTAKVLKRHRSIFGDEGRRITTDEVFRMASRNDDSPSSSSRTEEKKTTRRNEAWSGESFEDGAYSSGAERTRTGPRLMTPIASLSTGNAMLAKDIKTELRKNRMSSKERKNARTSRHEEKPHRGERESRASRSSSKLNSSAKKCPERLKKAETDPEEMRRRRDGNPKRSHRQGKSPATMDSRDHRETVKARAPGMDRVTDYVVGRFAATKSLEELQTMNYVEKVQEIIDQTSPIIKDKVERLKSVVGTSETWFPNQPKNSSSETARRQDIPDVSSSSSGDALEARLTETRDLMASVSASLTRPTRRSRSARTSRTRREVASPSRDDWRGDLGDEANVLEARLSRTRDLLEDISSSLVRPVRRSCSAKNLRLQHREPENEEGKDVLRKRLDETRNLLRGISFSFGTPGELSRSGNATIDDTLDPEDPGKTTLPAVRSNPVRNSSGNGSRSDDLVLPAISPEAPKSAKVKEDLVLPVLSPPGSATNAEPNSDHVRDDEDKRMLDDLDAMEMIDHQAELPIENVSRDSLNVTPNPDEVPQRPDSLEPAENIESVPESTRPSSSRPDDLERRLREVRDVERDVDEAFGTKITSVTSGGKMEEHKSTEPDREASGDDQPSLKDHETDNSRNNTSPESLNYTYILTEGSPYDIPDTVTTVVIPERHIETPPSDRLRVELEDDAEARVSLIHGDGEQLVKGMVDRDMGEVTEMGMDLNEVASASTRRVIHDGSENVGDKDAWSKSIPGKAASPKGASEEITLPKKVPEEVASPKNVPDEGDSPKSIPGDVAPPESVPGKNGSPEKVLEQVDSPKSVPEDITSPQGIPGEEASPKSVPEQVASPRSVPEEVASPKSVPEDAVSPKSVSGEVATPKDIPDEVDSSKSVLEGVASPKSILEEVAPLKSVPEEVASTKSVPQDAVSRKSVSGEVVTPKDIPDEVDSSKSVPEEVASPKNILEEVAPPKSVPEDVASPKSVPEDAVSPKSVSGEVATPKDIPDEVDSSKNILEEVAPPKSVSEEVASPKSIEDKEASLKNDLELASPKSSADPFGELIAPPGPISETSASDVNFMSHIKDLQIPHQDLGPINEEASEDLEDLGDSRAATGRSCSPERSEKDEERSNETIEDAEKRENVKVIESDLSPEGTRPGIDSESSNEAKESTPIDVLSPSAKCADSAIDEDLEDTSSETRTAESSNEVKETTITDGPSLSVDPARPFVPELNLDSLQDITVSSFKMTDDDYDNQEPGGSENTNSITETLTSDDNNRTNGRHVERANVEGLPSMSSTRSRSHDGSARRDEETEERTEVVEETIVKSQVEAREDVCEKKSVYVTGPNDPERGDSELKTGDEEMKNELVELDGARTQEEKEDQRVGSIVEDSNGHQNSHRNGQNGHQEGDQNGGPNSDRNDHQNGQQNVNIPEALEQEESSANERTAYDASASTPDDLGTLEIAQKKQETESASQEKQPEEREESKTADTPDEKKQVETTEKDQPEAIPSPNDGKNKDTVPEVSNRKVNIEMTISNENKMATDTETEKPRSAEASNKNDSIDRHPATKEEGIPAKSVEFPEMKDQEASGDETLSRGSEIESPKENHFENEKPQLSQDKKGPEPETVSRIDEIVVRPGEREIEDELEESYVEDEIPLAFSRSASQCTTRRVSSGNLAKLREDPSLDRYEEDEAISDGLNGNESSSSRIKFSPIDDNEIDERGADVTDPSKADSTRDIGNEINDTGDEITKEANREYHIYVPEVKASEDNTTTESSSIRDSAVTKIQAGARGFLARRRLLRGQQDRSSTLCGIPSIQDSVAIEHPNTDDRERRNNPRVETTQTPFDNEDALDPARIGNNFRGYEPRKRLRREDAIQRTTFSLDKSFAEGRLQHTGEFHDCIALPIHDLGNFKETLKIQEISTYDGDKTNENGENENHHDGDSDAKENENEENFMKRQLPNDEATMSPKAEEITSVDSEDATSSNPEEIASNPEETMSKAPNLLDPAGLLFANTGALFIQFDVRPRANQLVDLVVLAKEDAALEAGYLNFITSIEDANTLLVDPTEVGLDRNKRQTEEPMSDESLLEPLALSDPPIGAIIEEITSSDAENGPEVEEKKKLASMETSRTRSAMIEEIPVDVSEEMQPGKEREKEEPEVGILKTGSQLKGCEMAEVPRKDEEENIQPELESMMNDLMITGRDEHHLGPETSVDSMECPEVQATEKKLTSSLPDVSGVEDSSHGTEEVTDERAEDKSAHSNIDDESSSLSSSAKVKDSPNAATEDTVEAHLDESISRLALKAGDTLTSTSLSQESHLADERIESPVTMIQIAPQRSESLMQDDRSDNDDDASDKLRAKSSPGTKTREEK